MSQQEDDLRALAKIMDFMRGISFVLVAANMLWFTGIKTVESGWFYTTAYKILSNLDNACGLFHNPNNAKWFALLLLALSCFGTKGVKKESIRWKHIIIAITAGMFLYFGCWWMPAKEWLYSYIICTVTGYVALLFGGVWMGRMLKGNLMDDRFNNENESFMQETELKTNDYSVNLPTRFYYNKRWNKGWINVVNPFRATIVLGTPGSGKSYAVVNNYIKQCIEKGYSAYIYDFKFPDLSVIAMNHLNAHTKDYKGVVPEFRVINFDDPMRSHRCNPIAPEFMTDISDAYESAYTIMLNLNKTWVSKQGDFFVESPIILLAAIIWFLRIYKDGEYCTFPMRLSSYAGHTRIFFRYSHRIPNLKTIFPHSWTLGSEGRRSSSKAR